MQGSVFRIKRNQVKIACKLGIISVDEQVDKIELILKKKKEKPLGFHPLKPHNKEWLLNVFFTLQQDHHNF